MQAWRTLSRGTWRSMSLGLRWQNRIYSIVYTGSIYVTTQSTQRVKNKNKALFHYTLPAYVQHCQKHAQWNINIIYGECYLFTMLTTSFIAVIFGILPLDCVEVLFHIFNGHIVQ